VIEGARLKPSDSHFIITRPFLFNGNQTQEVGVTFLYLNSKELFMKPTLLVLLALFVFLSACASPTPAPDTADPTSSSMPALTDPSQPIAVNAGEIFMIVIESNPSTGYHWEIIGELNGVEFVSREYTSPEPLTPGSGGVEVWTFKASSAGDNSITLGNYPPGDGTTQEQEIQFAVTVQ
jgi:predicted secreted protein